jgi:alkylation response protein AidB-like acyl-CoA dehydrogenase
MALDFSLTAEQGMLKSLIERFVAQCYPAGAAARYRDGALGYSPENWSLLAELGVLALPFPEHQGGLGSDDAALITAFEALGRGQVVEPVLDHIVIGGGLIATAGNIAQQARWLPAIIGGTAHVALAHFEHATRYALTRSATTATRGRLSGAKTCVPGGVEAFVVTASDPGGFGLYLVPADANGVRRRDYRLIDGAPACELMLDAAPAEPLDAADAASSLEAVAETARLAACAEMVGLMSLLLDTTLDYVRQRQQFGAAIGSFQAVQHRLADLYVSLELSRSQLYRCVLTTGHGRAGAIAAAKCFISNAATFLGEECIQFHGGMGVSDELPVGHAHKRILLLTRLFGDADCELGRYQRAQAERNMHAVEQETSEQHVLF